MGVLSCVVHVRRSHILVSSNSQMTASAYVGALCAALRCVTLRQVPPYPRLAFEGPGGEARSIADALRIAVTAEVQGLLRCALVQIGPWAGDLLEKQDFYLEAFLEGFPSPTLFDL